MKIGFIGLGIMGKPMAKNLLKAGYELVVYDVRRGPVQELVAAGAEAGLRPRMSPAQGEIVITMLPNSPQVKEVVLGKDGVIEGAKHGLHRGGHELDRPAGGQGDRGRTGQEGRRMLDAPVSRRRAQGHRRHAGDHGRRPAGGVRAGQGRSC